MSLVCDELRVTQMQSIKSYGFESLEREILAKQIRTISTRMHKSWQYDGEGKDGDIVLVKKPTQVATHTIQVYVGKQPIDQSLPFLESPVRMMQLISLLEQLTPSETSVIDSINNLITNSRHSQFVIPCKFGLVGFNTKDKKLSTKQRSLATFIKNLASEPGEQFSLKHAKSVPADCTWEFTASYRTVAWHLAKLQGLRKIKDLSQGQSIKLASWPRVTEWDPTPLNFKLATLVTRQFLPISQIARLCKTSEEEVVSFLHCCRACGITILQQQVKHPPANQPRHVVKDKESLGWLRNKIRTVFNYGH
ncbi:hypothetical protein [Halioxenophilus aromaticivorans]|uniref:Uncharacterized protein n=1 Tax=Halioxenophilus aromaticivorans TaxID=1306992 RepID=A0AAV3U9G6_9ALTE